MPRISLQLAVEGSADVARSLQGLATAARVAFGAMRTESNTTTQLILANQRKVVLGETQSMNARRLLIQRAATDWRTAESAMVQAVATGAGNRLRLIQAEANMRRQLLDGLRNSSIQSEQLLTRAVEQEVNKRTQAVRAGASAQARAAGSGGGGGGGGGTPSGGGRGGGGPGVVGRMAGWVANNAVSGGMQALEASHDARYRRAATFDTLSRAMGQVGASRSDVQTAMGLVTGSARRYGLSADIQAQAIEAAQTEFSALGDRDALRDGAMYQGAPMNAQRRSAVLQTTIARQIERARAARNLATDPREYLRMGAMMDQNHVADVDNTLADFVAMAERGAVNLSQVAGTALQPMLRSVAQAQEALGPSATPEMRSIVANKEMRESLAFDEGLKSRGFDPRAAGTTRANMQVALRGNRTAELARTNLQNALRGARGDQRTAIQSLLTGDNALFQADPSQRGHFQFNDAVRGNPIALAETLHRAGLDGTTASNIFAGGGHGNARSLMAPWRTMNAALMAADAEGVTGFQAIDRISTAHHTPAERARMTDLFENGPMANFVRQEEARLTALADNTTAIGRMSEALDRFRADHPAVAPVVENAVPAVVGGIVALAGGRGGGGGGGGANPSSLTPLIPLLNPTTVALGAAAGVSIMDMPFDINSPVINDIAGVPRNAAVAPGLGNMFTGSQREADGDYMAEQFARHRLRANKGGLRSPYKDWAVGQPAYLARKNSAALMHQDDRPTPAVDYLAGISTPAGFTDYLDPNYRATSPFEGEDRNLNITNGRPDPAVPNMDQRPTKVELAPSAGNVMRDAMVSALSSTTVNVRGLPAATTTEGTHGATDRANAGANPQ